MKKLILVLALFIPLIYGCGSTNDNQNKDESVNEVELNKEIKANDSATLEIEKTKKEIEESSDKLDELLNDL